MMGVRAGMGRGGVPLKSAILIDTTFPHQNASTASLIVRSWGTCQCGRR